MAAEADEQRQDGFTVSFMLLATSLLYAAAPAYLRAFPGWSAALYVLAGVLALIGAAGA